MGLLVNGKWQAEDITLENPSSFSGWLGSDEFPAEEGRYHLYISHGCPFAHRAHMMLMLKGLDSKVTWSSTAESMNEGWEFNSNYKDPLFGKKHLHELYTMSDDNYSGRVTVPLLWDKKTNKAVNNESADIMRMLNDAFGTGEHDYYPEALQSQIDEMNDKLANGINIGVYKPAFADTQDDYESAVYNFFDALEEIDDVLSTNRYLNGNTLTESDFRLFATLIRFEPVYHNLFKCNLQHLWHYENVWNHMKEIYQMPEIEKTVNIEYIKKHYYRYFKRNEPKGIIPLGPVFDLTIPHNRARLKAA